MEAHINLRATAQVVYAGRCVGHLVRRREGFEAFSNDHRSYGVYAEERVAVLALMIAHDEGGE